MKSMKNSAVCVLLLICWYGSQAQSDKKVPVTEPDYHKPLLFSDLPDRLLLQPSLLDTLFKLEVGKELTSRISEQFLLKGVVVSRSTDPNPSIQSVVIRCTNRRNSTFTFTRIVSKERLTGYSGRIISLSNGDAYEIKQENGNYYLIKKNLYDIISE
ncbi:MAG: hypothetical protein ACJ748_05795 [Flavisolibacter sp.]